MNLARDLVRQVVTGVPTDDTPARLAVTPRRDCAAAIWQRKPISCARGRRTAENGPES